MEQTLKKESVLAHEREAQINENTFQTKNPERFPRESHEKPEIENPKNIYKESLVTPGESLKIPVRILENPLRNN